MQFILRIANVFLIARFLICFALTLMSGLIAMTVQAQESSQSGVTVAFENENILAEDGNELTLEVGRIQVPENRSRIDSKQIELAFVRVKYPKANPGPPVFFLAGGPGGSSIDAVTNQVLNGGHRYFDLVGGDIIGIDQRGVGLSKPNLETDTKYNVPVEQPTDPATALARMQAVCREEAARWRQKGVDLSGYTTSESADDIDAVRAALGYDKIVLWGGSYGTHLAMSTIRRHEEHIARALLISPEGPNHTHKLPSYAQNGLEKIAKLVAEHQSINKEVPDMIGMLTRVLSRLDKDPVFVSVDGERVGISKFDIQIMLSNQIGSMRGSGDQVPARIKRMADGDFAEIAKELLESRRESSLWSAMQMMMDCSSGMTKARERQIATEAKVCLLGDAINFPIPGLVEAWGATDLGDEFRGPLRSNIPVQFVVGDLDSRTPIQNANELMNDLPNSALIVVQNCGHSDLPMGMPKLRNSWSEFIRSGALTSTTIKGVEIRFASTIDQPAQAPIGTVEVTQKQLGKLEGTYRFDSGMVFKVRVDENHLVATIPGKGDFNLWPQSETNFIPDADVRAIPPLTFIKNDAGEIVAMEGGGITATKEIEDNVSVTEEELDSFVGRYRMSEAGRLTISREGMKLMAQIPGQTKLEVRPVSKNELRWTRIDASLTVVRGQSGNIRSGIFHQNGREILVDTNHSK